MNERKKTRLTPEEQELKERLMRSGEPITRAKGSGRISEDFWKLPKPKIQNGSLLEALLQDREEGR